MKNKVKVIDVFAGPGGLGEGFFSYKDINDSYPFEGLLSVEKDVHAHATLTLRAFYRLVKKANLEIPSEYFQYIDGINDSPASKRTEQLWQQAINETIQLEMGKDPQSDLELFHSVKNGITQSLPTVLIGGPPCQAYSFVGRARNKGKKEYIPEKDHRHFLYKEYLSIMEIFSPDVFVMENVKGMLSSRVNGGEVFDQIIQDLENCGDGYTLFSLKTGKKFIRGTTNPKDLILCSEDYGIPQNRHRVIILGVKNDDKSVPTSIPALESREKVSVADAIEDLPALRSPLSNRGKSFYEDSIEAWKENLHTGIEQLIKCSKLDTELVTKLRDNLKLIEKSNLHFQSLSKYKINRSSKEFSVFVKDSGKSVVRAHEARPHMDTDLLRYFYCSTYREVYDRNARAEDFPEYLAPEHKSWNSGKFVDRFKVQSYRTQSNTVTSHISKDGHYFIHSSPEQCRSLTVREAARIQSFPDSYQFMGKRSNQYHQVGNAVPPFLARQIAEIVFKLLNQF